MEFETEIIIQRFNDYLVDYVKNLTLLQNTEKV